MPKIKTFVPNEQDDLHCYQCCYRMVYQTIFEREIPMVEVEQLTNFIPGKPTWVFKGMLSLAKAGCEVMNIEGFPVGLFCTDPVEVLRRQFESEELVNKTIAESNLDAEVSFVKEAKATNLVNFVERIPTLSDITNLLTNNWFIICLVNSRVLTKREGHAGHFVVVEEITDSNVVLQNPGLPPYPNQAVPVDLFTKAWHSPNEKLANIMAIRKN